MIGSGDYRVADPEALETPAMLLFQDLIECNIRNVCELAGSPQNLIAHVKTHKSEAITRRLLQEGIDGFKCATLKELEMVLQAGARKAILAYPQVQMCKIKRLCDLAASYPDAWVAAIVSSPIHLEILATATARRRQLLPVMLDLDAGMHRTGIGLGRNATKMYREIDQQPFLLESGFHCYDGHDVCSDVHQREAAARRHIDSLQEFRRQIESAGMPVPHVVAGGGYSFAYYARTEGMHGSPGSFIYWDGGCRSVAPDLPFLCAAAILCQVVDRYPDMGTFTTDLGSKAICSDLPTKERARLLGHETAELILQNEEHGVFRTPGDLPDVGEYLLAVPGHIGPTTVCHPGSYVIDSAGRVRDFWAHTARDRK